MTDNTGKHKDLNDAIAALRNEKVEDSTVSAAGERVLARLQDQSQTSEVAIIRGCSDIQALLPAFRKKQLSPERAFIVEDHLHECVPCRLAFQQDSRPFAVSTSSWKKSAEIASSRGWSMQQWAVAAILLLVVGLSGYFVNDRYFAPLPGIRATVQSANGKVYLVKAQGDEVLVPGKVLQEGEVIRTAAGSHAVVRLFDGSLVEMNQRVEFSVNAVRNATTIHLRRGDIIVQAAKQRGGHLYVAAPDSKISVVGTIFAVNSGFKGTRVSVIEGEVHVAYAGLEEVLHPGDQIVTSQGLEEVPVAEEVSWSENRESHLALLAEFSKLQKKFESIRTPGMRFNSAILPIAPEGTLVYASIPNYGEALNEANRLFHDQLQESPVLKAWWQSTAKDQARFDQMMDKIHTLSKYIGDEVVFMAQPATGGQHMNVLVAAPVVREGLRDFLQAELDKAEVNPEAKARFKIVDEQSAAQVATAVNGDILIFAGQNFVVAASSPAAMQSFLDAKQAGQTSFAGTSFGKAVAASYQEGAGLLFAADLKAIVRQHANTGDPARTARHLQDLQQSGFGDAQHLIVKRREVNGEIDNRAQIAFSQQRHGVASWLAEPAPIGAMDFVSADAIVVSAAVVKNPVQMIDDMLGMGAGSNVSVQDKLAEFRSKMNFDLRDDLAASLGGDFAFAIDGPILPEPAWKFVVEVNDQARLQSTIGLLIAGINREATATGAPILSLSQEDSNDRTYYAINGQNGKQLLSIHYTFANGYLVAAPSRALVMKALQVREDGNSLPRSAQFIALLPKDSHTNVSALLYQNLVGVMGSLAGTMNPQESQSLQTIAANAKAGVICAYGDSDRIEVATSSKFFGFDVNNLALSQLVGHSKGTSPIPNP